MPTSPGITLASDTFTRLNQTGWGTASSGLVWSQSSAGILVASSIAGNQGQVVGNAGVISENYFLLGAGTYTDIEQLVLVSSSANGSGNLLGPLARYNGVGNYYACSFRGLNLNIHLGSTILVETTFPGWVANTNFWIRFRVVGTRLLGKAWQQGTPEPVLWQVKVTDATYSSGQIGLYAKPNQPGTTISYDNFSVTTIPTPIANPYGAGTFDNGTPNATGGKLSINVPGQLQAALDSGASIMRYQVPWYEIERAIQTTSSTVVSSTGSQTITLTSVPANFVVGASVLIDALSSPQQETVTITAQAGSTITATFTKTHTTTPYPVAIVPQAGDTPSNCGSPPRVQAYDWTVLDDFVQTCADYGLLPIYSFANPPLWHSIPQACNGQGIVNPTDGGPFLTTVLTRYPASTFYAVEVANEGYNTAHSTCLSMFTTQMIVLLQTLNPIIKQYSPNALIGAPAIIDNTTSDVVTWFTNFYAINGQNYVDYLQIHYYNGTNGPNQPNSGEDSFAQVWAAVHAISLANNDTRTQIWITETGWPWTSPLDSSIADYITQELSSAQLSGCVQKVIYFNLNGLAPGAGQNQNFSTLSYASWKGFIGKFPQWTTSSLATPLVEWRAATTPFAPLTSLPLFGAGASGTIPLGTTSFPVTLRIYNNFLANLGVADALTCLLSVYDDPNREGLAITPAALGQYIQVQVADYNGVTTGADTVYFPIGGQTKHPIPTNNGSISGNGSNYITVLVQIAVPINATQSAITLGLWVEYSTTS